jgi:tetratricopeptide (TPR) repeat protein
VLRQLRRIALPLLLAFAALTTDRAAAAEDPAALFNEGRYDAAAKAWLDSGPFEQLSADTLFNIGNAAYRLGSPGEAALYYRRALERDSAHPEARQNLRFLERKFGSITVKRPDYQHQLARVPLSFWQGTVWAAAWIFAIGLLVFPATRPGAGVRIAAIAGFVTAPLLALGGLLAWRHYPDDARFAPARDQVVIVADSSEVRTDAARTAPKVIDAPAGSLCRILTRSGEWAYVAFTNESRGWVPLVDIQPILPETTPQPPKLRPAPAGESESDA